MRWSLGTWYQSEGRWMCSRPLISLINLSSSLSFSFALSFSLFFPISLATPCTNTSFIPPSFIAALATPLRNCYVFKFVKFLNILKNELSNAGVKNKKEEEGKNTLRRDIHPHFRFINSFTLSLPRVGVAWRYKSPPVF